MIDYFPGYFSNEELQKLSQVKGKVLTRVLYTVWENLTNRGEGYKSLDWVELFFSDGTDLTFRAMENSSGIEIQPLNYPFEQTRVLQQFKGQVRLERIDMGNSPVWAGIIGQPVLSIGMEEHAPGQFANHILQMEIGERIIEITYEEEGLTVK